MRYPTTHELGKLPGSMRAVMSREGVRKLDQAKTLASIIEVSLPQAYKKLDGTSDMTLSQIDSFNRAYGVQLLSTTLADLDDRKEAGLTSVINEAFFVVGNSRVSCSLSLGVSTRDGYAKRFAAYRLAGTWLVDEISACPAESTLYEIERLEINLETSQPAIRRIAVVDDERGTADNLRDYLLANGNQATAFYDLSSARAAIEEHPFDGYFLDWRLADGTAEKLLRFIRASQPAAPIIVSTAGGADGEDNRAVLDDIEQQYNVACHRKPMKMKLLISIMDSEFAKRNNNG